MTYGQAAVSQSSDDVGIVNHVLGVLSGRDIDVCSQPERDFWLVAQLDAQVNNGGFDQFFFNGGGATAFPTFESLQRLGASEAAGLLRDAIEIVRLPSVAPDEWLHDATFRERQALDSLDTRFYALTPDLYAILARNVREHADSFR